MALKNPFTRGGKDKFNCQQDPQTGAIRCERFRQFEDGTTETLASAEFSFDGECKPVASSVVENEDGELVKLEKQAMRILKSKCLNRPRDY